MSTDSRSDGISTAAARERLRSAGLRCTTCRVAVLQQLSGATSPLSHADVADALVPSGFDKSTIYRSLVELADAGLVSRLELGDHVWRFEYRASREEHHPHFMCTACGSVTCLPSVVVQINAPKGKGEFGKVKDVLLRGECARCQ